MWRFPFKSRRSDQRRKFSRAAVGEGGRSTGGGAGNAGGNIRAAHRADDEPADEFTSGVSGARGGPEFRIHDPAGCGGGARKWNEGAVLAALRGFDYYVRQSRRLR